MTAFTAAYVARLELWGLLAALSQGVLALWSWRAWQRATLAASTRHRLACAHFAAVGLLPVLTLAILQATVAGMAQQQPHGASVVALPSDFDDARSGVAAGVAAVWVAGVFLILTRLAREARVLARARHVPAPARVEAALRRLAHAGLVNVLPEIREAEVASPLVAGCRRPRLLVPRGLSTRLAPAELDAVLLHELAHIRRGDLRWNLLQRIVLALLWFHPVAWWLQAGVARERERCCDALAVRHGASPAALARALVKLAEVGARPRLAMSMSISQKGALLERVQGLLESAPSGSTARHRPVAAVAISLACLLAVGTGRLALADPALGEFYMASAFGPTIDIQAHDGAGSFALRVRQGRVIQASVHDRSVGVVQQGNRVTLTDATRTPLLVLTVTPQGRVQWKSRA